MLDVRIFLLHSWEIINKRTNKSILSFSAHLYILLLKFYPIFDFTHLPIYIKWPNTAILIVWSIALAYTALTVAFFHCQFWESFDKHTVWKVNIKLLGRGIMPSRYIFSKLQISCNFSRLWTNGIFFSVSGQRGYFTLLSETCN